VEGAVGICCMAGERARMREGVTKVVMVVMGIVGQLQGVRT
jgi:hypothetical protein